MLLLGLSKKDNQPVALARNSLRWLKVRNCLPVCLADWRASLPTAEHRMQGKNSFGVSKPSMRCFKVFMWIDETYGTFRGRPKGGQKEGLRCIRCRKIEGKGAKGDQLHVNRLLVRMSSDWDLRLITTIYPIFSLILLLTIFCVGVLSVLSGHVWTWVNFLFIR